MSGIEMYDLELTLIRADGTEVSRERLIEFTGPPRGRVMAAALRELATAIDEVADQNGSPRLIKGEFGYRVIRG